MKINKLGKQFKAAHQAGVRWVVVCGPDDISENKCLVKDLLNGTQQSVDLDHLVSFVKDSSS